MKYDIIITYLPSAAQGRELEFAIAGWKKHFKEDFHIFVVGEKLPDIDDEKVMCIESPRVPAVPGQYRQHLDYVSCLQRMRTITPNSQGFILVADDCYAVRDFDIRDVKELKYLPGGVDYDPNSANDWRRDKMKTKRALERIGFPTRNFTTHLPIWYEWDRVEYLWERFNMLHESYVLEDLYHNIFFPVSGAIEIGEDDEYKCGVYTANPSLRRLNRAFEEKVWITNNPVGYTELLEDTLKSYYGL